MADELGRVIPVVTGTTTVRDAARLLVDNSLYGLIVANEAGIPQSVIFPVDVLRLFVPEYIVEDPTLARVYDEEAARDVLTAMAPRTVKELIDHPESVVRHIGIVSPKATPLEIAAELIRTKTAIAHVKGTHPARFVTLKDLLSNFITASES